MRGIGLGSGLLCPARADDGLTLVHSVSGPALTGWTGVFATIGTAGETDPETGISAASVLETAVTNAHYVSNNISLVQGVTYRIRVVCKAVSRQVLTVLLGDTPTKYWYAQFGSTTAELSTGMSNPQVTSLGSGWYAMSIDLTLTAASGGKSLRVGMGIMPISTNYAGDITKGMYVGSVKVYSVDP